MENKELYLYMDNGSYSIFSNYVERYEKGTEYDLTDRNPEDRPHIELIRINDQNELSLKLRNRKKVVFVGRSIPRELCGIKPEIIFQRVFLQVKKYSDFCFQIDLNESIVYDRKIYSHFLEEVARAQADYNLPIIAGVYPSSEGCVIVGIREKRILSRGMTRSILVNGLVPFGFVYEGVSNQSDVRYAKTQLGEYGSAIIAKDYMLDFLGISKKPESKPEQEPESKPE